MMQDRVGAGEQDEGDRGVDEEDGDRGPSVPIS